MHEKRNRFALLISDYRGIIMEYIKVDTVYNDEWIDSKVQEIFYMGSEVYDMVRKCSWGDDLNEAKDYATPLLCHIWESDIEHDKVYEKVDEMITYAFKHYDLYNKSFQVLSDIDKYNDAIRMASDSVVELYGEAQAEFYGSVPTFVTAEDLRINKKEVWWKRYEKMDTQTRVLFIHYSYSSHPPCDIDELEERLNNGHTLISHHGKVTEYNKDGEEYGYYGEAEW